MEYFARFKQLMVRPEFFTPNDLRFRSGLKFYALLLAVFILAKVIFALPAGYVFVKTVFSDEWRSQQSIVSNLYPSELVLTVTNGVISTNVSEPYPIALPQEWQDQKHQSSVKNLVVIDTTTDTIDTGDFAIEDTLLILGKYGFGYHDPAKGEFRIYDLRDKDWHENFTLTQAMFSGFVAKVGSLIKWFLLAGCIILPFFLYALFFVLYLCYLIFGAVVVWLGAKLHGHQMTYGQSYIAGFYLLPAPFLYEFFASFLFTTPSSGIPFAFTLILFVMTLINFPRKAVAAPVVAEATPVAPVEISSENIASTEESKETK